MTTDAELVEIARRAESHEDQEDYDVGRGSTTIPASYGDAPLPRRNGSKGMLPSTWQGHTLKIEYTDARGKVIETSGTLLDWFPFGPCFNLSGGRCLLAWDSITSLELSNA